MDYVDLYQIHRWDYQTPIEETLEALHDVVKAGKARYIGASSMYAWQFGKALYLADRHGWTRLCQHAESLQPHRTARKSARCCRSAQRRVSASFPGARWPAAALTRDWQASTSRSETDQVSKRLYTKTAEADRRVVESVAAVAAKRGVPPRASGARLALPSPP